MTEKKVNYYLKTMLINEDSKVDGHGGDSEVSQEDDVQFEHRLVPSFSQHSIWNNNHEKRGEELNFINIILIERVILIIL
mgnify:CR=1 FL=1